MRWDDGQQHITSITSVKGHGTRKEEGRSDLGDAVNGAWTHDRVVWRGVAGRGGPKGGDAAGRKDAQRVSVSEVEGVLGAVDVDVEGELEVLFASRRENAREMDEPGDLVLHDELLHGRVLEHVCVEEGALREGLGLADDVRGDDVLDAVPLAHPGHKLRADLSARPGDQDPGALARSRGEGASDQSRAQGCRPVGCDSALQDLQHLRVKRKKKETKSECLEKRSREDQEKIKRKRRG